MGTGTDVIGIMFIVVGFGLGSCTKNVGSAFAGGMPETKRGIFSILFTLPGICGLMGILWSLLTPPLLSVEVSGPPTHHRNDPSRSIYLGNGCFWHTQYDFVLLEQDVLKAFSGRSDKNVTSLVGYAGGRYQTAGTACYHGLPGMDYSKLGHGEVVSVQLDAATGLTAREQVAALARVYFEFGFDSVDGKRQRHDPQDEGPEYRNAIGLPGGMNNVELWPLFEAANTYRMPLKRGTGGLEDDTEDQFVVYVYDSMQFPFFRGESNHQFHENLVVKRDVPSSYTEDLKKVQEDMGRLDSTGCIVTFPGFSLLLLLAFGVVLGISFGLVFGFLPTRLRFWESLCKRDPHRQDQTQAQPSMCTIGSRDPWSPRADEESPVENFNEAKLPHTG